MRSMRPHLAPLCLGFSPAGFPKMYGCSLFFAVVVVEGIDGEQCVGEDFVADGYVAGVAVGIAPCRVFGYVFGAIDGRDNSRKRRLPLKISSAVAMLSSSIRSSDITLFTDYINMFRDSATVYVREPEHGGKCRAVRVTCLRISATHLPKHGYRVGCRSLRAI